MRLFYASFLDSANMLAYESLVTEISTAVPGVIRPIPARSHHLTMAFLGEIGDEDLDQSLQALESTASSQAFDFFLTRPRILYARRSPRLICSDVEEGAERISSLQALLRESILRRFPKSQIRAQSPHITLARFKRNARPRTAQTVSDALSGLAASTLPKSDRLTSVHLVKSTLTSSGPVYESLAEAHLRTG
jgi:2'-5' RNA ligase